jgi:hypothetical protein
MRSPELGVLRRLPAGTLMDGELVACDADDRTNLPRLLRWHGLTDPCGGLAAGNRSGLTSCSIRASLFRFRERHSPHHLFYRWRLYNVNQRVKISRSREPGSSTPVPPVMRAGPAGANHRHTSVAARHSQRVRQAGRDEFQRLAAKALAASSPTVALKNSRILTGEIWFDTQHPVDYSVALDASQAPRRGRLGYAHHRLPSGRPAALESGR